MKVLITGGSGFIGTNLINYFLEIEQCIILNIDIVSPRCKEHLSFWEKVDIIDFAKLKETVVSFNPDYIVHLAARTDIKGSDVNGYIANTVGVENIIKVSSLLPNLQKIIFTSSMLICRVGYKMKDVCDYLPPNAYGESKVQTEKIIKNNAINCDWSIIRPTSIWGEWFDTYRDFFEMVMSGKYVFFGKKASTKTYGYIGNTVYQIASLLFTNTKNNSFEDRIYFLGDRPSYNIEDWANEIAIEARKKIYRIPFWIIKCAALCGDILKYVRIDFPMNSFRLKNMTTDNIINIDPIFKIAPNPPFSRLEATRRTMNWIRNHYNK